MDFTDQLDATMPLPNHVTSHLRSLQLAPAAVHYNLKRPRLYEEALDRNEGQLAAGGPLVTRTAPYTGRSPKDRFIVRDASVADQINWGEVNQPTDRATFDHLHERMAEHAEGRDLFVQDLHAGWDESYRLPVRIITEKAWHSLFARNMFVRPDGPVPDSFEPGFTVVDLCEFEADPERDGTHSEAAVFVDIAQNLILIGGTHYGGEIKKSIFSVLNYMLPEEGVLPMHCSANEGEDGDTAVFFGLSGTGKTTLSADASRTLIGDDEHGWSDRGVYNFEGGCYAKMIDITPESEPEIHGTTEEFGTILENVIVDPATKRAGLFGRYDYPEHARLLPPPLHSQHLLGRPGRASGPRSLPNVRRVRRTAPGLGALARAGSVPLSERLHGQGRRHRGRGKRAQGHLQHLLWRAVHGARPVGVR
jgi:Phosphoenolpyruvate carboxykinase (ATP)